MIIVTSIDNALRVEVQNAFNYHIQTIIVKLND